MNYIPVEVQEGTNHTVPPPHYIARIRHDHKNKDVDYKEVVLDNEWVMDKIKFNMVREVQATMHSQGFEQVKEDDVSSDKKCSD